MVGSYWDHLLLVWPCGGKDNWWTKDSEKHLCPRPRKQMMPFLKYIINRIWYSELVIVEYNISCQYILFCDCELFFFFSFLAVYQYCQMSSPNSKTRTGYFDHAEYPADGLHCYGAETTYKFHFHLHQFHASVLFNFPPTNYSPFLDKIMCVLEVGVRRLEVEKLSQKRQLWLWKV